MKSFSPVRNLVYCRPLSRDEYDDHIGQILLPEQFAERQKYAQWVVVKVGPRVREARIVPGARILIGQNRGTPVDIDGEEGMFVSEPNIKAIFQGEVS